MERNFKAVIFDLDGTLLNTLEDIADATNSMLKKNNYPVHYLDEYRYFVGEGIYKLIERAIPADFRIPENIKKCIADFREEYTKNWDNKTQPYPGIPELLNTLQKKGTILSILSNKSHAFVVKCVNKLLSEYSFKNVLGQRDGHASKPDPEGALLIAENLSINPENIIFLGDTKIDMITAKAAGMFPAGVLWGFRPKEELITAGAKATVKHPSGILELL